MLDLKWFFFYFFFSQKLFFVLSSTDKKKVKCVFWPSDLLVIVCPFFFVFVFVGFFLATKSLSRVFGFGDSLVPSAEARWLLLLLLSLFYFTFLSLPFRSVDGGLAVKLAPPQSFRLGAVNI